jgi:hypothetical protein
MVRVAYSASETMTEQTRYCCHCSRYHPATEMRQINSKYGKRWRCIKSLEAIKKTVAERDAFGRENSQANVFWSSDKPRIYG